MRAENLLEVLTSQAFHQACFDRTQMIPNHYFNIFQQTPNSELHCTSLALGYAIRQDRCMVLMSENAMPGVDGRWKSSKHGGVKTIQGGPAAKQVMKISTPNWQTLFMD